MELSKSQPLVPVGDSIRDALRIIDQFAKKICYVIDNGKLIGVATDGDIKKGIANRNFIG